MSIDIFYITQKKEKIKKIVKKKFYSGEEDHARLSWFPGRGRHLRRSQAKRSWPNVGHPRK
jgi:hypothetical protein